MSEVTNLAGGRIRSIIGRVEQVELEIRELLEGKKEIFAGAKGEGFDVKIIKLRKQEQEERDEHETLLDVYMRAITDAGGELTAKAAKATSFPNQPVWSRSVRND